MLGLLGALILLSAPAGLSTALPALTLNGPAGWVAGLVLGALAGQVPGVPWPWWVLALNAPPPFRAAAFGGFAASALLAYRAVEPDDPNAVMAGSSPGAPARGTVLVLLLVAWALTALAWGAPAVCLTLVLVIQAHGRWLAAAGLLAVALCAAPDLAVSARRRRAALRSAVAGPAAGLLLWVAGLWIGARFLVGPAVLPFAAAGGFALAPALWSRLGTSGGAPARPPSRAPRGAVQAHWPEHTALRALMLALLALGTLRAGEDPLEGALSFAAAASLAGGLLLVLPAPRVRTLRSASCAACAVCLPVLVGLLPWSGFAGFGALLLATAYSLWLRWSRLPVLLHLTLWVPLIR